MLASEAIVFSEKIKFLNKVPISFFTKIGLYINL